MAVFIDPFTDFGFKKLFGTELNKDLLIDFLNALLAGKEKIENLTYLNSEQLGMLDPDRRYAFLVYCETDRGEKILVEMQKCDEQFFKEQRIYYATFPFSEQAPKNRWSNELKAIYIIGILNFCFYDEKEHPNCLSKVKLMETYRKEVFYDKLTFYYLEVPKFTKTEDQLETEFDKWLFVLRELSDLTSLPAALQERVFTKLFKTSEIACFKPKELLDYEDSLKVYRDWENVLETAKMKARAEGMKKGYAESYAKSYEDSFAEGFKIGKAKAKLMIAKNLKRSGFDTVKIMEITKLSEEEIASL